MIAGRAPWFTAAWIGGTSLLYVALADASGFLAPGIVAAVGFVPVEAYAEPWRFLVAPAGLLFSRDAIQFAYVTAVLAVGLPAFEYAQGWRRTAVAFVAGALASVLLVSLLVYLPLHLAFPDSALVVRSVARPYMGGSTGAFAVLGALAAVQPTRARVAAVAAGALAWETFIAGYYFRFAELIPLFHYAAIACGFLVARARWFSRIPV